MRSEAKDLLKRLNESFGSYRAEWLRTDIFDLFTAPSYFPGLQDLRPCVLEGGRGTGKTTVLKGLSYQGQFAFCGSDLSKFDKISFVGIYHRVNTNHVRAFNGGKVEDSQWEKIFSHYFNLIICREILLFIKWYKDLNPTAEGFTSHTCGLIADSANIEESCNDLIALIERFDVSLYSFQAKINNITDGDIPKLSMAGVPINLIIEKAVSLSQFKNKSFFILLDEYENYEDYQQKIINTLIKHNSEHYTFKIGVREMGWRIKNTTNPAELLNDPADYILFNIEQKLTLSDSIFADFAKEVCQKRIEKLLTNEIEIDENSRFDMENSLVSLSIEDEAIELGVMDTKFYYQYESLPSKIKTTLNTISPLYKFFIVYWSRVHNEDLITTIRDYQGNKKSWDTRYDSYKYEMLFKIRRGRGKSGIQKFYTGWNTYTKLAKGNIRYLMELVYRAYEKHLNNDLGFDSPVSHRDQTLAAQETGHKNLIELEGLWKNGAQIIKLLLGIGRVFQLLASGINKTAPEQNQFSIQRSNNSKEEMEGLITAAVMHLALVRTPGNKMGDDYHTKDYLYMIHPIFSAFFQISYRKKRKIELREDEMLGLIKHPKQSIINLLQKNRSHNFNDEEINQLPQQMNLFQDYYNE